MEIQVLDQITVKTLPAFSTSVSKVFIARWAHEMLLIWLYLAICCDMLEHHGELSKP